jgi:hypothetical protein
MRYLIPRFFNPLLIGLESLIKPLQGLFSLYWHIRVRKQPVLTGAPVSAPSR